MRKLGDFFRLQGGYAFKSKDFSTHGIPVIKIGNITGGGVVDFTSVQYVAEDIASQAKDFVGETGDVLIAMTGANVGKVARIRSDTFKCLINQRVGRFQSKPNNQYSYDFLFYLVSDYSAYSYFANTAYGSAQPNISGKLIESLEMPTLGVYEANRIGQILNSLDEKIIVIKNINQTLESIAQELFQSWFVDFDPVKAKLAAKRHGHDPECAAMAAISGKLSIPPGKPKPETLDEQLPTQETLDAAIAAMDSLSDEQYESLAHTAILFPDDFEESGLGMRPSGWKTTKIGNVAKITKGKSYKSSELSSSNTALVTLKSFNRGGGYRLDGLKEYIGKYKPEQEVFAGDLIIAYTDVTQDADVIGKPTMVISDPRYEHLVISLDVAVVRPDSDLLKYYLYGISKTEEFQSHTRSYTSGTTVLHLSKSAVPEYQFSKPPDELIEIYKMKVEPMFSLVNENTEECRTLTRIRDTLLPKLLSGEIRIPESEQEQKRASA